MKNYLTPLVLCGFLTISCQVSAAEPTELLIKLQRDIFTEMLRSHGPQIEDKAVLTWCEQKDLAEEVGLSINGLKRAVYDSFIVAGTKNVQATEIARQMNNDDWDIYNNALFSDISRYQQGIQKGLNLSYPSAKGKSGFCQQAEQHALKAAQTVSH